MDENKVMFYWWPDGSKTDTAIRQKVYGCRQFWNTTPAADCSCGFYSWGNQLFYRTQKRYSANHIGLGTKRFIDNLGGC